MKTKQFKNEPTVFGLTSISADETIEFGILFEVSDATSFVRPFIFGFFLELNCVRSLLFCSCLLDDDAI